MRLYVFDADDLVDFMCTRNYSVTAGDGYVTVKFEGTPVLEGAVMDTNHYEHRLAHALKNMLEHIGDNAPESIINEARDILNSYRSIKE